MNQVRQFEAQLFAKYLGAKIDDEILLQKYIDVIEKLKINLTEKEQKILYYLVKMPFLLPFADAAWALVSPKNGIRKRILIMSALIETQPQYLLQFLNQKDLSFSIIRLVFRGSLAVVRAIFGVFLILFLRWK